MASAPRAPGRSRRTQAERRAATRGKIVDAVVDAIAELGLAKTTAVEIERRAGVTWGAVQHHFGGKDGLLMAVLESSFAHFARCIADVPRHVPLDQRAGRFVEGAWRHYQSRSYHSTFEILLSELRRDERAGGRDWRGEMQRAWDRQWRRLFDDAPISRRRQRLLQHYTLSVLAGLASTQLLGGEGARANGAGIELLKDTLARELRGEV